MSGARCVVTVLLLVTLGEHASADDLRLFGTSKGVEFHFAIDRPNKGCTYGVLKNTSGDKVEVEWGYDATSETGGRQTVARTPDSGWILSPGESVGGWAAILWCPFNSSVGDAPATERMTVLRIINVRVRNLSEQERQQELERQREDQRRAWEAEQRRLADERAKEEQRKLDEQKRLADEKKRRDDEQKKAWAEQKKREDDLKQRQKARNDKSAGARSAGGGTGVVDAETQRRQRIAKGFQDLEQARKTNNELGKNMAAGAATIFMAGGGEQPSVFSKRLFQLDFGFGGRFWPVMTDTSGSDIQEFSSQDTGGGFSFDVGLQYWPIYRARYGVGAVGHFAAAGMAMPGGALYGVEVGAGVQAYAGRRTSTTVRAELGILGRTVGNSSNLIGAITTGSGSYRITRLGVGIRRCLSKVKKAPEHCAGHFGFGLLLDFTGLPGEASGGAGGAGESAAAKVFRGEVLGRWLFGVMGLTIEFSPSYPAPGETSYTLDEDRNGLYFAFLLRKAWTWY